MVLEEILIAAVEFASAPGPHEKNQAHKGRNAPDGLYGRREGVLTAMFRLERRIHSVSCRQPEVPVIRKLPIAYSLLHAKL